MAKKNKGAGNALVQGSILAIASIISRIIGLIYRIPMQNILGDIGIGYYSTAFEIYNVMLIISSYSLPTAVSKMVSAQMAKKNRRQTYQILKCALLFATTTGTIVALILFFGGEFFETTLLNTPFSIFALKILAPTLLVVAILGVLRGFFQGLGTMMPSAVSQIIEQVVNAIVSVWAAYVLYRTGSRIGAILGDKEHYAAAYGAAGGTLGTALGAVAALIFVIFIYMIYMTLFKKQMKRERNVSVDSLGYTMKVLIITVIPVLLSTTIYNISSIIDQGVFKQVALLQGYSQNDIDVWWGIYTGKFKLLINVPISIASAMAASFVPVLTGSYARRDMEDVRNQINLSTRFVMVVAFPCTVGLAVLATPIFNLLFNGTRQTNDIASCMMWIGAVSVLFYAMSTLSNGLLQGIDRLKVPVINAAIALGAHVIVLVALMLFFRLNIYAVVLANAFFALLMCFLNSSALKKYSGFEQEIKKTFIIPAICSIFMGAAAFVIYFLLDHVLIMIGGRIRNAIAFVIAFVIAVIVYAITLLLFKGLSEDEIRKFPKGTTIIRFAKKFHLL